MKPTKVKITAEHIKLGVKEDPCECPIALALQEAGYEGVSVEGDCIEIDTTDGSQISFDTTTKIQDFTAAFDSGKPVRPMTISMPVPPDFPGFNRMVVG